MLTKLILENVRCFHGRHEIPLRPLTFLIGENSTGKSTLLAAARIASASAVARSAPDFNEPPFNLGAFDEIASYAGGRLGRSKKFCIGMELLTTYGPPRPDRQRDKRLVRFVQFFEEHAGQPEIVSAEFACGGNSLLASRGPDGDIKAVFYSEGIELNRISLKEVLGREEHSWHPKDYDVRSMPFILRHRAGWRNEEQKVVLPETKQLIELLEVIAQSTWQQESFRAFAFAPIRSEPKRTYDPQSDTPQPQGNHVPMFLAQTSSADPAKWAELRKRLADFGRSSGLFTDIRVRRQGSSGSAPFQILVRVSGAHANLIDVGYGVSQIMPILVDAMVNDSPGVFLLQQPEVHLHPRAQAEIGSFLGLLAKTGKKQFLVETHSDYLIDRVCLDLRDKKNGLSPEDVLILYFQRKKAWVKVHHITIDANGNLVGAPKGYRDFFLKEQARLFGV